MPFELLLGAFMWPVIVARSVVYSPSKKITSFVPATVGLSESSNLSSYVVSKRFGSGSRIFDVYNTNNGAIPRGPVDPSEVLFWFLRSRLSRSAFRMYSSQTGSPQIGTKMEPMATIRAGFRSNILLISASKVPVTDLGWHVVHHDVDGIDAYRVFTLADGSTYQWTYKQKYLELVHNRGNFETEVRQRIGSVEIHGLNGFTLKVDESKIPLTLALASAWCSFIDMWSSKYSFGGVYWPDRSSIC